MRVRRIAILMDGAFFLMRRPKIKPASCRIAVKVINHLGDEVMKVFRA
jgi:hypothetical protein